MAGQLVFVYGTLTRGGTNHALMKGQVFRGTARSAPGFRLIHLGTYPGLIAYPEDRDGVLGEVWTVDAPGLARLDELEGVNEGLYRRGLIPLMPAFDQAEVQTYFYLLPTTGLRHIDGGRWTEP